MFIVLLLLFYWVCHNYEKFLIKLNTIDNVKELSTNFNNDTEMNQRYNIKKYIEKIGKNSKPEWPLP